MKILNIAVVLVVVVLGIFVGPAARAQQPGAQKALYERLGGLKGITMVSDDFINRLVVNKTLNQNPAINAGRRNSPPPYLKFQVSQLLCEVSGGPCKYTGLGMKESHVHLNITRKEWDVMAGEFQQSLDKFRVPAAEQKELFSIVGTTMPDIVTRK